jgi:predicted Rossmann-fold nucleotide-binding protein
MAYKIGVYGSNVFEGEAANTLGISLGQELARRGCGVITGGCSGMPYVVARAAAHEGAEVWGYTPELSYEDQLTAYPDDDISIYQRLVYVPRDYHKLFGTSLSTSQREHAARLKYRNVISTTNADAGIIISGSWGTLNEFTNLVYDGKPIGVLLGSGGLADELPDFYPCLRKRSATIVLFEHEPQKLVVELLKALES